MYHENGWDESFSRTSLLHVLRNESISLSSQKVKESKHWQNHGLNLFKEISRPKGRVCIIVFECILCW